MTEGPHRRAPWHFVALIAIALIIGMACGGDDDDDGGDENTAAPAPPTVTSLTNAAPAVARVELLITTGEQPVTRYWGSGAFIAPGYVLTSARLLDPAGGWDTIGIAPISPDGDAASLAYQADVVAIDPSLDVAVLRIAANREGEEIAPEEAAIGAQLVLGSDEAPRNAVGLGYAARDSGQPAGVRLEFSAGLDGEGEWLEAPTVLPPGYAGAPVLDDAGAIVGLVAIPEPGDEAVFVRRIADARPMIEAALRGQELLLSGRVRLPPPERSESDFPRDLEIGGITFYTDLTPDGDPVGPTDHFPEGTRRIVYAFEYAAMRDGLPWLDEWRINGELDPQLSEPRPPWNRGPDGTLVSSINEPNGFSSGEYEVRVIVDSVLMASARVDVGDVPAVPNLKSLALAPAKGDDGQPVGVDERLESASTLYGFFDYEGMDAVSNWGYVWYHGDDIVAERDGLPWRGGGAGSDWWVAYYEPDGSALQEGEYTLTLLLDGEPSATARVTIGAS